MTVLLISSNVRLHSQQYRFLQQSSIQQTLRRCICVHVSHKRTLELEKIVVITQRSIQTTWLLFPLRSPTKHEISRTIILD